MLSPIMLLRSVIPRVEIMLKGLSDKGWNLRHRCTYPGYNSYFWYCLSLLYLVRFREVAEVSTTNVRLLGYWNTSSMLIWAPARDLAVSQTNDLQSISPL